MLLSQVASKACCHQNEHGFCSRSAQPVPRQLDPQEERGRVSAPQSHLRAAFGEGSGTGSSGRDTNLLPELCMARPAWTSCPSTPHQPQHHQQPCTQTAPHRFPLAGATTRSVPRVTRRAASARCLLKADALHLLDPETMSTTTAMAKNHFHPENSGDSSPYPHQPRGASRGAPLLQNPHPVAAPGRLGRGWRRAQHLWLSNKINHYVLPPPAGASPSSTSQGPAPQQHPFVALVRVLQRGPGGASAPRAEPGSGAAEWGTGRGKAGTPCTPAPQPWGEGRSFSPRSRKTAVLQVLIL